MQRVLLVEEPEAMAATEVHHLRPTSRPRPCSRLSSVRQVGRVLLLALDEAAPRMVLEFSFRPLRTLAARPMVLDSQRPEDGEERLLLLA